MCWAAAATARLTGTRSWWRKIASVRVSVFSALVILGISVVATGPSAPAWATAATLEVKAEQGWIGFTDTVAEVYATTAPGTPIVTEHYWQASAVNWFGSGRGMPPAHSPHRGFAYFGAPAYTTGAVVYVGTDPAPLHTQCVRQAVTPTRPGQGFDRLDQGVPVWVRAPPAQPWATLWPQLRHA
ncbi:hypothetical protein ACWEOE_33090 [Amycolatopsis sp. NPDC004368]